MKGLLGAGAGNGGATAGPARGWQPPALEELQRVLPQYEISAFVARGGMGAVYKGVQRTLKRPVAIKVLPPEADDGDLHFAERFKREAQAMARLSHPNIVTVYDAGEVMLGETERPGVAEPRSEQETGRAGGTLLYFVMEYIEGTDVARLIAAEGALGARRAVEITVAVCEALAFAHEEGIIHRDIKPSNVMIDKKGRVKVADFGLAKSMHLESTLLTRSDVAVGTPDFIAPEMMLPGTQVDQRADLYAVGVMLYQMLTGRVPRGRFEMPSGVVPQMDKRFDRIVDKAMQTDRDKRYSTATEMKRDVEKVVPKGAPAAAQHRSLKKPVLVAAAALVLGAGAFWATRMGDDGRAGGQASSVAAPPASMGSAAATKAPTPALPGASATPAAATKDAPFVNSLGMKFVPVPITGGPTDGKRVLFSIWETRKQDYEAFAKETKREWKYPGFEQGPTHPAVNMTWGDANAFCTWLTERERKAGRIGAEDTYRLPSDHEWSCAVGIGDREDPSAKPRRKNQGIQDVFPWGAAWPPPTGIANLAGEESAGKNIGNGPPIPGFRDDFVHTAPVGSFAPSRDGLFDLAGNVGELCAEFYDADEQQNLFRVARGGAFVSQTESITRSSCRLSRREGHADRDTGFRPVLVVATPVASATPAAATKDAPFVNSLGMKFVPVPITGGPTDGKRVLFSVWETRVQDYEAFATEMQRKLFFPGWLKEPTQPANVVSWNDAKAFCAWLTERERKAGRIGSGDEYRLPLDHEWSCAVGIGDKEDPSRPPADKDNKLPGIYPWGTAWPPPPGSGNFADETLKADHSPDIGKGTALDGYNDGFSFPAPVGSFAPNGLGLFDLAGNIQELCGDLMRPGGEEHVIRGTSWRSGETRALRSDIRNPVKLDHISYLVGFRPVLVVGTVVQAKGDDRAAAEWALGLGGRVTLKSAGRTLKLTSAEELPQGTFAIVEVRLENLKKQPANLAPLSGLADLSTLALVGSGIRDELLPSLGSPPKLRDIFIDHTSITDEATGSIGKLRAIETLTLSEDKKFTGRRLGELALPRLSRLCLQGSAISDEGLKQIGLLRSIDYLDLCRTQVTDAGMAALAPLGELAELNLWDVSITSAGLAALGPAVPLRRLGWTFPREEGAAQFEKVAAAFPQLSFFSLETRGYAAVDIPALAAWGGLRNLQLLRDGVTDDMLRALLELPQITSIHLRDCQQFTGPGLARLLAHPALVSVKLEDLNQITDADVLQLTAMKRLTSLGVLNCKKITPEGIDAFRRARPDVKIEQ